MDSKLRSLRSKVMASIKSSNTSPELLLRKALWGLGLRYKLQNGIEKADIAFPRQKLAIFVDGCFWHSCPIHGHVPKSNVGYWAPKLKRNVERAIEKDRRLSNEGWEIIHFWEHEVRSDPVSCAKRVRESLLKREKQYIHRQ